MRTLAIFLLLLLGVAACVGHYTAYAGYAYDSWLAVIVLGIAGLTICCLPELRRSVGRAWDRLDRATTAAPLVSALAVFVVSSCYLWVTAVAHARDLSPRFHDEFSYRIQAQMLARGRLWMPPLPDGLGDFFESFHLLVKPVYASIYFPGTALAYAPGVWTGAPGWLTSILLTALAATLLFAVARELLGGGFGVLAALMLLATPRVRWTSTSVLSQLPAMLDGLLIVWTWMRWRKSKHPGWAVALGASVGWATIVRPFDLLAFAIPVGILFLLDLRGLPARRVLTTIIVAVLAAAPFAMLQFILNRGTTGDWFTTPYRAYIDQFQPGSALGFRAPPENAQLATTLQQKIDLYQTWAKPQIDAHRLDNLKSMLLDDRLRWAVSATLPSGLFLAFLPLGFVAAARDRRLLVFALAPFLFFALYLLNPYFVLHYAIVVAPAVILCVLAGVAFLAPSPCTQGEGRGEGSPQNPDIPSPQPSPRVQGEGVRAPRLIPVLAASVFTLAAIPELHLDFGPEADNMATLGGINQNLPKAVEAPAVVLFRYYSAPHLQTFHSEPVYNYDVAWPLDAPIIRAHDLGPERYKQIVAYFARHEPQRVFYLFDRRAQLERRDNQVLRRLGRAGELNLSSP